MAEVLDYSEVDVLEELRVMTGGRAPTRASTPSASKRMATRSMPGTTAPRRRCISRPIGRTPCVRRSARAGRAGRCRIPGVYGGWLDKFPLGPAFAKGLTLKMGQTHMQRYLRPLLDRIERGEIDPSFIVTHRVTLDDAPEMYRTFRDKRIAASRW